MAVGYLEGGQFIGYPMTLKALVQGISDNLTNHEILDGGIIVIPRKPSKVNSFK